MTLKNIKTPPANKNYLENFDRIFKKGKFGCGNDQCFCTGKCKTQQPSGLDLALSNTGGSPEPLENFLDPLDNIVKL